MAENSDHVRPCVQSLVRGAHLYYSSSSLLACSNGWFFNAVWGSAIYEIPTLTASGFKMNVATIAGTQYLPGAKIQSSENAESLIIS